MPPHDVHAGRRRLMRSIWPPSADPISGVDQSVRYM